MVQPQSIVRLAVAVAILFGVLFLVLTRSSRQQADRRALRAHAYPEFMNAMQTFIAIALAERGSTSRSHAAQEQTREHLLGLDGVASEEALTAADRWWQAGGEMIAARAAYDLAGDDDGALAWSEARAAERDAREDFGRIVASEIGG